MTAVLRMSQVYAPTLKEDPADADIASAKLLQRAGMIRKEGAGLYTFMPLGLRVLRKIENIVREEMDSHGAQELRMPFVQSADLWHRSGRWEVYGQEMMRLVDRHGNEYCLGPTAEEMITDLIHNELKSYKDLPKNLYHIQLKFRDERRPRFGLLRSREFLMKDAYSFDADEAGLDASYLLMRDAYSKMCERMGFNYCIVAADSGEIGGTGSEEFMALAETGECEVVFCDCGYAADTEIGATVAHATEFAGAADGLTKINTPGIHSIAELSDFLGCAQSNCAKAFSGRAADGTIWVMFVPGNYEVNELKARHVVPGFEQLTDEEMEEAGLVKGSMGPIGLPAGIKVAADESLKNVKHWIVGANEDNFHFTGAVEGVDFTVDVWGDLCTAQCGDTCPKCGGTLDSARGIEVGQIFKLGTKYSSSMGVYYMDEDGSEKPFVMGCYGVGVSRCLAAMVEQSHDDYGIIWPYAVAPAHICVVPLTVGDEVVQPAAEELTAKLAKAGFEVVIDDRDERAGVKFAEADLFGWPLIITVGKRGLAAGTVEMKLRHTGQKKDFALEGLAERLAPCALADVSMGGMDVFDALFEE